MADGQPKRYRQWISYQALLLGGFSTLATALLVAGNLATRDAIEARHRDDLQASLSQVIPASAHDNDLLENPLSLAGPEGKTLTVYRGTRRSQVSALAWEISGQGYAGEIRLLLGLDTDGRILGVRVLSHAETPGLGDRIEVEKDDWILEFDGLSLGNPPRSQWKVKKDGGRFDAFSGATITPRAVVQSITAGLAFFERHQGELLASPAAGLEKQESTR
ncbi:MAG TPA: electron transport complex subunit RsxG [Gammaproteobacteria bacterium]|nr:electron transport complex subunit RsxG [Gammaproteobacteria bacterium]